VPDYHSRTAPHSQYYHEFDACPVGSKIPPRQRLEGSGGKPLCPECERMQGMDRARRVEGGDID
jgi:hypothetical protein